MTSTWGIHSSEQQSPFLATGRLVLERAGIGDLSIAGDDRATIKAVLRASYPTAKNGTVAAWAGVLRRFAFDPHPGDLVVHPERATRTVSLGRVAGGYFYQAPGKHCRRVTWLARRVPRARFSDHAAQSIRARVAFFAVPDISGELAAAASAQSQEART